MEHPTQVTQWPIVWAAFGAGVVAASHIGKLPPALPVIRLELEASLIMGGWIASMISVVGFAAGIVAGAAADRIGVGRVIIFGLLALATGSLLGTFAITDEMMLVARFIESIGFTSSTVTGAAIIARATADKDRKWALGVWAIYMPTGFAGMMLLSAFIIEAYGWRTVWAVSCALSLLWAIVVLYVTKDWRRNQKGETRGKSILGNIGLSLASVGGLLVAGSYAVYAAQQIGMMSWLPTYMSDVYHSGVLIAAAVPALVLAFNAGGNYAAARAMGRGYPIWMLLALGAGSMAVMEIGMYSSAVPDVLKLLFILGFGFTGGLIPAAALAAAPIYAPTPAQIGTMSGLMVMATNAGQLFGPPALAAARERAGSWDGTLWLVLSLAVAGFLMAVLSRPMERRAVLPAV
jgi:DHA1 family inner membrane transport protein